MKSILKKIVNCIYNWKLEWFKNNNYSILFGLEFFKYQYTSNLKSILHKILTFLYFWEIKLIIKKYNIFNMIFIGIVITSLIYYTIDWFVLKATMYIPSLKVPNEINLSDLKTDKNINTFNVNNINMNKKDYLFSSDDKSLKIKNTVEQTENFNWKGFGIFIAIVCIAGLIIYTLHSEQIPTNSTNTSFSQIENNIPIKVPEVVTLPLQEVTNTAQNHTISWLDEVINFSNSNTSNNRIVDFDESFYENLIHESMNNTQISTIIETMKTVLSDGGGQEPSEIEIADTVTKFISWFLEVKPTYEDCISLYQIMSDFCANI